MNVAMVPMRLILFFIVLLHTCQGFSAECANKSGVNPTEQIPSQHHGSPQNAEPTRGMKCCRKSRQHTERGQPILVPRVGESSFQQIYQYSNSCITELKLNPNVSTPQRIPMHIEISNGTKCLQKCMLEKAGFVSKDGKIREGLWPRYPGTNLTECQSIKDGDECQEVHLKTFCMTDMGGPLGSMISVKAYEMAQYSTICASELNLNVTNYRLFRPSISPRGSRDPSKEVKCLERCVLVKAGYLTEDNKLLRNKWNLGDRIDVGRCESIDHADACEKSYSIHHCVQTEKVSNSREHRRQPGHHNPPQGFHSESLPGLREYHEECANESGISPTERIPRGQRPGSPQPTRDMKCFKKCLLEKGGYLNGSNIVSNGKLPKHVNVTVCEQTEIDDQCEMAYQIERCLMKQMRTERRPRVYFRTVEGGPFEQVYRYSKSCATELNLNLNVSIPLNIPMHIDINNETKCLQKCMLEKAGYVGEDGKIREELWPRNTGTNSTECQSIREDDKCHEIQLKTLCMTDMPGPPNALLRMKNYEFVKYRRKCASELNLNETNYRLFRPSISPPGLRGPSKEAKCLERCMLVNLGYLTEDNKFVREKWNLRDEIDIGRCVSITHKDACEESYAIHECIKAERHLDWQLRMESN